MNYQEFMINFAPKILIAILLIWFLINNLEMIKTHLINVIKKNLEVFKTHLINVVFYIGIYFLLVTLNIIPAVLDNVKPSYSAYSEVER
jgi:hypothetical protein